MGRDGKADIEQALVNVIEQALQTSGIEAQDIGHLHAHGLSGVDEDASEARAIARVFGEQTPPVTALKSFTGNLGARSGLVELISSVLAFNNNALPPVLNCEHVDSNCPIAVNQSLDNSPGDSCLSVNVSPQGQAGSVLVKRFA